MSLNHKEIEALGRVFGLKLVAAKPKASASESAPAPFVPKAPCPHGCVGGTIAKQYPNSVYFDPCPIHPKAAHAAVPGEPFHFPVDVLLDARHDKAHVDTGIRRPVHPRRAGTQTQEKEKA